jgi:hypothetical protein
MLQDTVCNPPALSLQSHLSNIIIRNNPRTNLFSGRSQMYSAQLYCEQQSCRQRERVGAALGEVRPFQLFRFPVCTLMRSSPKQCKQAKKGQGQKE